MGAVVGGVITSGLADDIVGGEGELGRDFLKRTLSRNFDIGGVDTRDQR